MSRELRIGFLVHAAVALVFGLLMLLIPATSSSWLKWTPVDVATERMFGAALIGLAVGSWLGSRATSFEQVRIKLWIEMVYGVLGALAGLYQVLFAHGPGATWLFVVILAGFAALWIYLYINRPATP